MTTDVSFAPTSFPQQRLWFFYQLHRENPLYNLQVKWAFNGILNASALVQALNEIVRRHEVLRTVFQSIEGRPVQVVLAVGEVPFSIFDLRTLTNEQRSIELPRILSSEFRQPFDLERGPTLRVSVVRIQEREQLLVLTVHHIVFDGWSVPVFLTELAILYEAFQLGRPSPLPELRLQYADFAKWQRGNAQDSVVEMQLEYWKKRLLGAPTSIELPTDRRRPPMQTFAGAIRALLISASLAAALRALGQSTGVTLFMTVLAAFALLLSRYCGQDDLLIGTPIANRGRAELEPLIGFFVNTLALRIDVSGDPTFVQLLARVRDVALEAYNHQDVPFEKLVEELRPQRDPGRNPLFQVMFVFQNATRAVASEPNTQTSAAPQVSDQIQTATARFDMTLTIVDAPPHLHATLEYNTDLFDAETVGRIAASFTTLLEAVTSAPNRRISQLSSLTPEERHRILVEWNTTKSDFPSTCGIHQLFEKQASEHPDRVALTFEGRSWSYDELNRQANRAAHSLLNSGVGPEARVGIFAERSVDLVTALLGVLKAGAAAVPLDPSHPRHRLAFYLDDAQIDFVLAHPSLRDNLSFSGARILELGPAMLAQLEVDPRCGQSPSNVAYVIYTSGSTGIPKGVLVEHRGLCNVITAQARTWEIGPKSRVLQFAPFVFDAAMSEIFTALTTGACLCLAHQQELLPGPPLIRTLREQRITTITLTPSALSVLPVGPLPDLKVMIVAGEACDPKLAARWATERKVFNAYGPTEASICATTGEFDPTTGRFPIGRPLANTQIFILDRNDAPVPIGVPGEIHIGGVGIARGYLNRPALTEQSFRPNRFVENEHARLYRTGDFARYAPDGSLEFLGRIDDQVKLRGFRIEPGEIENALRLSPAVKDAAVLKHMRHSDPGLVAYIVPAGSGNLSNSELRHFLQQRLPEYMVPSAFVKLESFPRTSSGKVDRHALSILASTSDDRGSVYVEPKTNVERTIAAVWQELLGVEHVGLNDNFFDLGGHSLLLVRVHARLQELLSIELSLVELFRHPTIGLLAQSLVSANTETSSLDRAEKRAERQRAARLRRSVERPSSDD